MKRENGILIALLAFAAGVGVGMLLAPTSGDQLRRALRDRAKQLPDDLKAQLKKFPDLYADLDFSDIAGKDLDLDLMK